MTYSVLTYLPEIAHLHWMHKFSRVAIQVGLVIVTLEPRIYLREF